MFRLIVAGSRSFADRRRMWDDLDRMLSRRLPAVEIVSGGASGADALAVRYALSRGLPYRVFLADWDTYGLAAGPMRNELMALYGDALIVYWDGESRGTKSMIREARARGLRVVVRQFV